MANESFSLTRSERVTVRRHDGEVLEVEASYGPGGKPPPAHLHPAQDERFEVLEGSLQTRVDGVERTLGPGETLEIPRGAAHQMWNASGAPTRVRWETRPAGRTLDWFREIDAVNRRTGFRPGPLDFGVLLTEYRDVFRLAVGPQPIVRAGLAGLGAIGRATGRG